jgi:acyl-[acyl carrier protein]--UDP-N-acetylglucosamine O-acyltransferase
MLQGQPFRVRGVNTHNLRRCGFGDDDIRALKRVFRDVFNGASGAVDAEAIGEILADPTVAPPVRRVAEVIQRSLESKDADDG